MKACKLCGNHYRKGAELCHYVDYSEYVASIATPIRDAQKISDYLVKENSHYFCCESCNREQA